MEHLMGTIKDLGDRAFRDSVISGVPASGANYPRKRDVRELFAVIDTTISASANGVIQSGSWAGLSSVTGTMDFQPGRVIGPDTGTHIDAFSGEPVANEGEYRWSSSAQRWIWVSPTLQSQITNEINERSSMVRIISLPGILAALTDDLFNSTFIAARSSDGKPTDYSRDVIWERLSELGWLPLFVNLPGYRRLGNDEDGNLDWSCLRSSDGKWPDWMYPQVAEALQPFLADAGGGVGLSHEDRVLDGSGGLIPAMADMTVMSGWGSSGMYRARFQLAEMASELGASYYNGAWSGERSTHTAAKLGAIPALLTFPGNQIPASGTVTVTCSNVTTLSGMPAILGTVSGVAGSLVTSGSDWTWTRTTAGDAVPLTGEVEHLPSTVETYRGGVGIISTGKNDLTAGMSAEGVIERTDACFDHFSPLVKRVVVRGHFHNTGTPAVSSVRDRTNQVNVAHQMRYGPLFIDIEPFIFGPLNTGGPIWALLGLTPNSTDLAEMALRNLPPSLGADAGHFTTEASAVIVSHLIKPHLTTALNWY